MGSRSYSGTSQLQWNLTATVEPHSYSGTSQLQWNLTATVEPHFYGYLDNKATLQLRSPQNCT